MRHRGHKWLFAAFLTASIPGLLLGLIALVSAPTSHALTPGEALRPVLGRREVVTRVAGVVLVRSKGAKRFSRLSGASNVADGSEVDAKNGRVAITVATPQAGVSAMAFAYQGRFRLHQDPQAPAETHLILSQPISACAPARGHVAMQARARAAAGHHGSHTSRRLWVSEKGGNWGTGGHYVSTTVEGTRWLTIDQCHQSEVKVAEGTVVVHDLIRHSSVTVSAGHKYVAAAPSIQSRALLPPAGQVFTGVTGGSDAAFQQQVGKHPAVTGYFTSWGEEANTLIADTLRSHTRLLMHVSTDDGYGATAGEVISPAAIARGEGDFYLLTLSSELAAGGQPTYLALLPEMNQANNAYSAFNANGSPRGRFNSTANFRQAWRRSVLIVRGGPVAAINQRLRKLGLPAVKGVSSHATLARPRVAFMWAPQTAGSPDIPTNGPAAYYPGSAYVDIVGTDFYSAFPNFAGLARLYAAYPSKPFGFNEWAMWRSGDPGFIRQLFAFIRSHRRIGLMLYNQGFLADGPFRLLHFPAAKSELRRQLRSSRFLGYAPEWTP